MYCCRKGIARLFDICSYRQTLVSRQICHESRIMLLYFLFRACIIARYDPENLSRTISFERYFRSTLVSSRFSLSLCIFTALSNPQLFTRISGILRVVESPFFANFATTTPHVHTCHQSRLPPYVVQVYSPNKTLILIVCC